MRPWRGTGLDDWPGLGGGEDFELDGGAVNGATGRVSGATVSVSVLSVGAPWTALRLGAVLRVAGARFRFSASVPSVGRAVTGEPC